MNLDVSVSHLLIDEAAQIIEPEALIPFNLLRDKRSFDDTEPLFGEVSDWKKKIILTGDQKQLAPIAHSVEAIKNGFTLSMFERLFCLHSIERITEKQSSENSSTPDTSLMNDWEMAIIINDTYIIAYDQTVHRDNSHEVGLNGYSKQNINNNIMK